MPANHWISFLGMWILSSADFLDNCCRNLRIMHLGLDFELKTMTLKTFISNIIKSSV